MARQCVIDLHTHGIGGLDTRTHKAGDILRLADMYGRAGVGAFVPTIYSAPVEVMRAQVLAVGDAIARQEGGARILGAYLEGPFINPDYAGAQTASSPPSLKALRTLVRGLDEVIKVITVAPELKGATGVIKAASEMGIKVCMGHSGATLRQAEKGVEAGATGVTHLFNAMRGFHHREPGLAGLALTHPDIYVEAIADGVHLSPEALKMIFAMKPRGRVILVSDSIKGPQYRGATLQGSKMKLPDAFDILEPLGITRRHIAEAMCENPARFLGVSHRQLLRP